MIRGQAEDQKLEPTTTQSNLKLSIQHDVMDKNKNDILLKNKNIQIERNKRTELK